MADASIFAEGFKDSPYWWEAAPPGGGVVGASLPDETDCAIVGSGYSGLSCALELAHAGVQTVVLDREEIGWGASTRNGGMLSAEPKFAEPESLRRRFGDERAERILEDGRSTLENLREICARESIDCELQLNGRFVGAHSPAAYRELEKKARTLEAEGKTGFELIPRGRQHEVTDTDYYHGGLRFADGGSLHPALYHRGLVEACRRNGVVFCPRTEVLGVERVPGNEAAGRFRVHTASGSLESREVVLGTNGYTGKATPWHRRRLVPLGSFIIATEELGEEAVERMFRGFCTMSNTQRILFYYRPSPDHRRVVFGGRASFRRSEPGQVSSARLHRYLGQIFPGLRGVRITHGWSGNVAFTFDGLPHMGVHEGVHYCMGCNGSGVQMMSFLGRKIALKILGRVNRPCGFDDLPFPTRPFYGGEPWFLPLLGSFYRLRDRLERLGAG